MRHCYDLEKAHSYYLGHLYIITSENITQHPNLIFFHFRKIHYKIEWYSIIFQIEKNHKTLGRAGYAGHAGHTHISNYSYE